MKTLTTQNKIDAMKHNGGTTIQVAVTEPKWSDVPSVADCLAAGIKNGTYRTKDGLVPSYDGMVVVKGFLAVGHRSGGNPHTVSHEGYISLHMLESVKVLTRL